MDIARSYGFHEIVNLLREAKQNGKALSEVQKTETQLSEVQTDLQLPGVQMEVQTDLQLSEVGTQKEVKKTSLGSRHDEGNEALLVKQHELNSTNMSEETYPLALTVPKGDSSDFSDWLSPNSRLPSDIVLRVEASTPEGEMIVACISGHRAIIVKAIPSLDGVLFETRPPVQELKVKALHGKAGIKAFKIFILYVYGRKIKMEEISGFPLLLNLAELGRIYDCQEVRDMAVTRMEELLEQESDYEALTIISSLTANLDLEGIKSSLTTKIQSVVTEELNRSVLAKLEAVDIVEEKDKVTENNFG